MNFPPFPVGIYRDDTVHGRLYYTRQQMFDFAQAVLNAQPKTHTPQATYRAELPDFLRGLNKGKRW